MKSMSAKAPREECYAEAGRRSAWSARNLMVVMRRRLPWAMVPLLAALAATIAMMSRTAPAYRASTTLVLEGRTLPLDFDVADLERYAAEDLRARNQRVLASEALARLFDEAGVGPASTMARDPTAQITIERLDAVITPQETGDLDTVSIAFSVSLEDSDRARAELLIHALQASYLADHERSEASRPTPSTAGLKESSLEADRLTRVVADLAAEIEAFEQQNAAGLPELYELNAQAMERADRERAQLDNQILSLDERRMELGRALRDVRRAAVEDQAASANAPTSQRLIELQSERAVLLGRYGNEHPEAQALSTEISELQAAARERVDVVNAELQTANVELARMERIYPIDHPDVVRLSHQVSALELRIDQLTVTGLSIGERQYVESLARERRDIELRLDDLRARQEALRASVADHESRALQRPLLEQQYAGLQEELARATARHEAALARQDELAFALRIAEQTRPGRLVVTAPALISGPLLLSRPGVLAALGATMGVIGMFLITLLMERRDRRVSGAWRLRKLHGAPPLAEIPFIQVPARAHTSSALRLVVPSVMVLLGLISLLVLTGVVAEDLGALLLEALG